MKNKRSLQLIFNSLKANLEKQSSNESAIENFKELIEKNQNSMESYATLAYRDYISVIKNSDVISEHRSGYYNSRTLKPFIPESLMFTMILDVKERIRVSGTQGA